MKFKIKRYELHVATHFIEADSKVDAIEIMSQDCGPKSSGFDSREFFEIADNFGMPVEENFTKEEAEDLNNRCLTSESNFVCSIDSIEVVEMSVFKQLFGDHDVSKEISALVDSEVKAGIPVDLGSADYFHHSVLVTERDLADLSTDERYIQYIRPVINAFADTFNQHQEITIFRLDVPEEGVQYLSGIRAVNHLGGEIPVRVTVTYGIHLENGYLVTLGILASLT